MKIAQIAPLAESVPPQLYGGTERIVSYLTEELVRQGHDVTLFASGDSVTAAELVPCSKGALRLDPDIRDPLPYYLILLEEVRRRADEFDILHFHIDLLHFPLIRPFAHRTVTTLHGRLDLPDLVPFYQAFREIPVVPISNDQRRPLPMANWVTTIHHGLPLDALPFSPSPTEGYLAFLGRISPEKRPDRAIEIASRLNMPLKIAAKVDRAEKAYWDNVIAPMIARNPNFEYVGEVNDRTKAEFLGNACALLFPIDWPEPFGLVMIEAMSCGTPVIAFRHGSVPEVVDHGVSGFIVDSVEEAVEFVPRACEMSRAGVRRRFEERFTVDRMATDYVAVYERLLHHRLPTVPFPVEATRATIIG
ncbi:glycosyltransferase family 4 protein [Chelativorans sp. Marseille-P2723]|uniref:glycosyltransferase family 4 protein n=1 Tax=Chelativorans sp. Marseille-P2723 TaxID=2709133 RepID=UPI00156DE3FD|nr:glycosyltransferase family 4 protein [Chelativorans sp. Marseille-P2723]